MPHGLREGRDALQPEWYGCVDTAACSSSAPTYRSRTRSNCVADGGGDVVAIVSLAIRCPCALLASTRPDAPSITVTVASCPGRSEKVPLPILSRSVALGMRRPLCVALPALLVTVSVSLPAHLPEAAHRNRILALPCAILSVAVMTSTASLAVRACGAGAAAAGAPAAGAAVSGAAVGLAA